MGQIQYPNEKQFAGPWLLNRNDLEKLDDLVSEVNTLLRKSWTNKIEMEILEENPNLGDEELITEVAKKQVSLFEKNHTIECQFITNDGTKLSDESINGLLRDNALSRMTPIEIHIVISHGSSHSNKFNLRVARRFSGELQYELRCYDPDIKEEIQYKLDSWIEDNQPKKVLQIWTKYGDLLSFLLFAPLALLVGFTISKSYSSYGDIMRKESYEIIEQGIDSTNIHKAIDLLLRSESGYIPSDFMKEEKPKDPIYMRLLLIGIFIFIIGIVRPKTTLGIGQMKTQYRFYLFWIKVVTITLPTVLVLGPFWKNLTAWLY